MTHRSSGIVWRQVAQIKEAAVPRPTAVKLTPIGSDSVTLELELPAFGFAVLDVELE